MITKEQALEFLKSGDNTSFLKDNGFQTEVEKKVEVPAQITDELVTKFIGDNQGYRDKLHNGIETDFLKRKTGLETITPEMLGEKLFLESGVNTGNEAYKKAIISASIGDNKYRNVILQQLDGSKIEFKDGKLEGFEDQINGVKTKYPAFFEVGNPATPPLPGTITPQDANTKLLEEAKKTGNVTGLINSMFEPTKE